ncbi:MAG: hypothetical protein Q9211_003331 [Gyalolechia sp. 1 TL-2023]
MVAILLPTFAEDHIVSNMRSVSLIMELKREIGQLQDDIKAVRFILGGIASRDWVDHGILGRRVGSAWSHNHLFLEPVDEAAPKIAPKNQFHQQAHWVTIAQAHEETAKIPATIKAQYCQNTNSRNPIGQKGIIQSYTVEKLQEVFSLVSPKQLPHMSAEVKRICESYMNLRVAPGMDDYILRTRTPRVSKTIERILRPHLGLSKQCETYNLYDVCFLLRQKIDDIPEPQKSQIVENWRSQCIVIRKRSYFWKRLPKLQPRKSIDSLKPEIDYRTQYEPPSTNPGPIFRQPLQASSLESTTEATVLPVVATSSTPMAKPCGLLLQQDPIRPTEWRSLRPGKKPGLLHGMLGAIFSPLMAKGYDPTRPVKRIGPYSLRKRWPLDRISGLLWKHGFRSVLRRKV